MAQLKAHLHDGRQAGFVRRLLDSVMAPRFVRVAVSRVTDRCPSGTIATEAMRDTGVCPAYRDYAVSNGLAAGEARRLYSVTHVALGTFPH